MRNYIQFFKGFIDYHVPPPIDSNFVRMCYGGTKEECEKLIEDNVEAITSAGYMVNNTPGAAAAWFLLDKKNLVAFLNNAATRDHDIPYGFYLYQNPNDKTSKKKPDSPRHGWKDSAGVERKPPPSEKSTPAVGPIDRTASQLTLVQVLGLMASNVYGKNATVFDEISKVMIEVLKGTTVQADVDKAFADYNRVVGTQGDV